MAAFWIIGTGPAGAEEFAAANAKYAINKYEQLQRDGYQKIVFKDDFGRTLSLDQMASLSLSGKS